MPLMSGTKEIVFGSNNDEIAATSRNTMDNNARGKEGAATFFRLQSI